MENRERRSRIRSSIRDYYDLQASPDRQQQEKKATEESLHRHRDPLNAAGGAADHGALLARQQQLAGQELNMDSDHFNSAQYTTKILKEKTLKQLYEKDTELRKTVRELDGNLQDLVYNNYTNFIAATDTIRDMRGNVEDMDQRLHALSTNVERIDDVSKTIRGKLEDHRGKIEEVLAVNKMLQKIKFLVALPEAMRKFVGSGRYTTAAKYWLAGDAIFKKYSNIASFKATHQECREIAEGCYLKLLERIKTTDLEADKVEPIRADVEALRSLRPTSISIVDTFEGNGGAIGDAAKAIADASDAFEDEMMGYLFAHAKDNFNAKVGSILASVDEAFLKYDKALHAEFSVGGILGEKKKKQPPQTDHSSGGEDHVADDDAAEDEFDGPVLDLTDTLEELKEAAFSLKAHRLRARDILMSDVPNNFQDLLMQDVFPVITQVMRLVSSKRGAAIQMAVNTLASSLAEIGTDGGANHASIIAAATAAAAAPTTKKHASHAVSHSVAAPTSTVAAVAVPLSIQQVLSEKCDPSVKMDLLLTCVIRELRAFAKIPTKILKLDQLVDTENKISENPQGEENSPPPRCSYTDDIIHLLETLVKDELLVCFVTSAETMAARAPLDIKNLQQAKELALIGIVMRQVGKVVVSNLRSALGGTAVETALKQALHTGSKSVCSVAISQISGFIGAMLTDAVDSGRWNAKPSPSGVSAFLPVVIEELRATELLLHSVAPGEPYRGGGGSATGSGVSYSASSATGGQQQRSRSNAGGASSATGGNTSGIPVAAGFTRREHKLSLAGNMDRLMASKVGSLNCTKPSSLDSSRILECITLAVVKSWTEAVRGGGNGGTEEGGGKVYNKGGFQQMQVDVSFFLLALKEGAEQTSMAPAPSSASAMPVVPVAVGGASYASKHRAENGGSQRFPLLCHKEERLVEAITEMLCSVYERCTEKVSMPSGEVEAVAREAFASDVNLTPAL